MCIRDSNYIIISRIIMTLSLRCGYWRRKSGRRTRFSPCFMPQISIDLTVQPYIYIHGKSPRLLQAACKQWHNLAYHRRQEVKVIWQKPHRTRKANRKLFSWDSPHNSATSLMKTRSPAVTEESREHVLSWNLVKCCTNVGQIALAKACNRWMTFKVI